MRLLIILFVCITTNYSQISKISYVKYADNVTYIKPLAMKELVLEGEASEQFRKLIAQTGMKVENIFVFGNKSDNSFIEVGEHKDSKIDFDKIEYTLRFSTDTSRFYNIYMRTFKKVSPRRIHFLGSSCISKLIVSFNKNCDQIISYTLFPENQILDMKPADESQKIEDFINSFDFLDTDDTEEMF